MTVNASEIPSVVAMSNANIATKRDLRYLLRDRLPDMITALDGLGSDPIISGINPDLTGRIQHVDLTQYYEDLGEITCLLTQAYNLLGVFHNTQTEHGEGIGIVMDAPNGGGGDR